MICLNTGGEKSSPKDIAYLVFDIETVLDPDMPPPDFKPGTNGLPSAERNFPNPSQCKIVSIAGAAMTSDFHIRDLILFGRGGKGEEAIVWDFARYVTEASSALSLVTWNGRGFDMPVIAARLLKYGWPMPAYFSKRYRYKDRTDDGAHIDLMDQLSDYGASSRAKLDHAAKLIGLPGKVNVSGADVADLYAEGRQADIDFYCVSDVIQTAFVFWRWAIFRGVLSRQQYREVASAAVRSWESAEPEADEEVKKIWAELIAPGVKRKELLLGDLLLPSSLPAPSESETKTETKPDTKGGNGEKSRGSKKTDAKQKAA